MKRITPHTLRHAYCTHSLRAGNDIATVRERMGHETLETTLTYAHGDRALGFSPLDVDDIRPVRTLRKFEMMDDARHLSGGLVKASLQ